MIIVIRATAISSLTHWEMSFFWQHHSTVVIAYDILIPHVLYYHRRSTCIGKKHWMLVISAFTKGLTHLLLLMLLSHVLDNWFECSLNILHPLVVLVDHGLPLNPDLFTSIRLLIDLILLSLKSLFKLSNALILVEFIDLILKHPWIRSFPLFPAHLFVPI